ncbi:extensin family protein [Sinorhizobium sp. RAC02]|uniref:extensin-like domain-containing protein n=1 Tax=Sinorhizobium sp. RAC02 TaxID=1842534 RepID=UPI00083CA797|nr:extensin family protein [Sinorhizobium sp. RAC02]AOF88794.1 extensin-like family protein [Sinorhizobium sp. RAC02]
MLVLAGAADLPKEGPLPAARPEQQVEEDAGKSPEDTTQSAAESAKAEAERKAKEEEAKAKERPHEDGKEQAACRTELKAIGATFEEAAAVNDGKACGIDRPVLLKGLAGDIKLEPQATIRCDTALQLAHWVEGAVKPSLEAAMPGEAITGVAQASAYVCKNRNGAEEGRISEHAFGNAIDIAGFSLKSGKTITVRPADKDSSLEGAFQRAITESACLYFTTVLDPGSDAAHQNHLHLDVKERRGGYRYCW